MNGKAENGGVAFHMKWAELIAAIGFFIVVGPSLIYIGSLSTRLSTLEDRTTEHRLRMGHPVMEQRVAVVESRFEEILNRLKSIETNVEALKYENRPKN